MKLYKVHVDFKKVRKHFVFSLILRKRMIPSGETGYGTECGIWVFQGKLWQVIRNIYNVNHSYAFLNGCKSDYFDIYQGVVQGCALSPTLFLIFINGLMKEIERTVPSLPSLEFNGFVICG